MLQCQLTIAAFDTGTGALEKVRTFRANPFKQAAFVGAEWRQWAVGCMQRRQQGRNAAA
jgi:hypothetical protein